MKFLRHAWLILLLAGWSSLSAATPFAPPPPGASFAADHFIVKFKPDALAGFVGVAGGEKSWLRDRLQLGNGTELIEDAFVHAIDPARKDSRPDLSRFLHVKLPAGADVLTAVAQAARQPGVEYAEPDGTGTGAATTPNDPNFASQWHHLNAARSGSFQPDIHSTEAWDITTGSTNIIVAVLDTGLAPQTEFTNRTVAGYDFVNLDTDPADDHGHGTAVSGVIAANANNGVRIAGVNWKCRLMPLKVLDSANSGFYSAWTSAIDWAVTNGAKVINLSAGGSTTSTTLTRAITNAIAKGVIFVTITHNDSTNIVRFPGSLTNCITVGSTDSQDRRSTFSNWGPQNDMVAPGTSIATLSTGGALSIWSGTSFAAPQVAGVAALLCSVRPELTHDQVAKLLYAGADDRVGDTNDVAGYDQQYGWGRLNSFNSLVLAGTRATARVTNGQAVLNWRSPPNASNRLPYRVESALSVLGPWTAITAASNFTYAATNTTWRDPGTASSNRFYRVSIQP